MEINPYAATASSAEAVSIAIDDAELTRRKYLSHEASIQSVGLLYMLGAAFSMLTVLGLLGIPIGTLISLSILYLLLSEKGRMVFSPEYKAVIAATPHVRYRTSLVNWVLLFVFLAVLVGLVAFTLLEAKGTPPYRF